MTNTTDEAMKWPQGSTWRKWDLHCHTPSSYDYTNKAVTDEDLVAALRNAGVSAVAITDHHLIDVERIANLRAFSGPDLTIFPGIELRTELGGKQSVHMIGIFSEEAEVAELWTRLQVELDIMPATVKKKRRMRRFMSNLERLQN